MKVLEIQFKDGTKVSYKMSDDIDHMKYLRNHGEIYMKRATLQKLPKKNNKLEILV